MEGVMVKRCSQPMKKTDLYIVVMDFFLANGCTNFAAPLLDHCPAADGVSLFTADTGCS